jgi:hypothetical protein
MSDFVREMTQLNVEKFCYKKANWAKYKQHLEVCAELAPQNVEELNKFIIDSILMAAKQSIPLCKKTAGK